MRIHHIADVLFEHGFEGRTWLDVEIHTADGSVHRERVYINCLADWLRPGKRKPDGE